MTRNALALCLILLSLCACRDRNADPPESGEAPADAGAAAPVPSEGGTGAPVGPISSRGQVVAEESARPQGEGAIDFDIPESWQAQPPSSSLRMAQAVIPGSAGPGELAVFYFGPGSGGSVEANIERWIGQMESTEQPERETFETNGYRVTWVEVRGTLNPSQMGTGPATPQPNSRLLGAVVEGPGGPWFFKATGPDATLAAERDAFLGMLKSARAKG